MKKVVKVRLKELRGPVSQAKFAASLGLPQQTYANYETGRSEVSLSLLCELSSRFGVSTDWLLGLRETARAGNVIASGKNSQAAGRDIVSADPTEVSRLREENGRLRGEVAALERALAMFAPKGVK